MEFLKVIMTRMILLCAPGFNSQSLFWEEKQMIIWFELYTKWGLYSVDTIQKEICTQKPLLKYQFTKLLKLILHS